jgi:hypothetical protein
MTGSIVNHVQHLFQACRKPRRFALAIVNASGSRAPDWAAPLTANFNQLPPDAIPPHSFPPIMFSYASGGQRLRLAPEERV